ncbi:MAG: hypothetical protein OEM82_11465 [Acidobacteriota bacterium]|nr:hypothetical protein [Acidobacteriota bacterium]MDH3530204.1 hypothetical protein [Acidobacteriota bacterium]
MLRTANKNESLLPENKLEVSLEGGKAVIRLSSYVEGLGWCSQKTMELNAAQAVELQTQITEACRHLSVSADREPTGENVIPFPHPE